MSTEANMGDMNKIVTEHVRVSDLPVQCRQGLDDAMLVRVTVEPETTGAPRRFKWVA